MYEASVKQPKHQFMDAYSISSKVTTNSELASDVALIGVHEFPDEFYSVVTGVLDESTRYAFLVSDEGEGFHLGKSQANSTPLP